MLNRDLIIKFVQDNFDEKDYRVGENEIQANSPFHQDSKFHLGISLREENIGVWNILKPPQDSGDFFKLVSLIQNCSIMEAKEYLIEHYLHLITLSERVQVIKKKIPTREFNVIPLPKGAQLILKDGKPTCMSANTFLNFLKDKRNIDPKVIEEKDLMFCYEGQYKNCIIIPFYDDNKNVIYWVARNVHTGKYLNIPNNITQGKGGGIGYNILTKSPKIVLVEGVFDALRLPDCAIALLSNKITDNQLNIILRQPRSEIIVVGDNYRKDVAGEIGARDMMRKISKKIDTSKTKLMLFLWTGRFADIKDLSRCPFDINLEEIEKHSEPFGEMYQLKMKVLQGLST